MKGWLEGRPTDAQREAVVARARQRADGVEARCTGVGSTAPASTPRGQRVRVQFWNPVMYLLNEDEWPHPVEARCEGVVTLIDDGHLQAFLVLRDPVEVETGGSSGLSYLVERACNQLQTRAGRRSVRGRDRGGGRVIGIDNLHLSIPITGAQNDPFDAVETGAVVPAADLHCTGARTSDSCRLRGGSVGGQHPPGLPERPEGVHRVGRGVAVVTRRSRGLPGRLRRRALAGDVEPTAGGHWPRTHDPRPSQPLSDRPRADNPARHLARSWTPATPGPTGAARRRAGDAAAHVRYARHPGSGTHADRIRRGLPPVRAGRASA